MNTRPCFVIPIYNHGAMIAKTVERLRIYALPVLVVDDGSDVATQQVLQSVVENEALVRLFRLPINQGKGAAVMRGLQEARALGFTHALQIDADGQHDATDVPRFLAASEAHPHALICGRPVYDNSIPKSRLYGRKVTHFWVAVETLALNVPDSMCGFRLYPLQETCRLIEEVRLPTRMAFDIEILVRLMWRGMPVVNLETRVTYPADGLSHFKALRDNVHISACHTRLTLGMLPRLPWLLWRRRKGTSSDKGASPKHWSRLSERGSAWGMGFLFWLYRLLGPRAVRWMLYPVVGYFFLSGRSARNASRAYLERVYACTQNTLRHRPSWRDSFRHMMEFAESGVDKLGAWLGRIKHSEVSFENQNDLDQILDSGRGALIIGAHLGNLEMTRALANKRGIRTVNAVVYSDHAQRFAAMLARSNADFGCNLIQVSTLGPDTAMMLQEKIDHGEWLVIVGDRTPPSENGRISEASFLGDLAPFAQGPFILASLLSCPVYLFFCLKEAGRYQMYFEHFADRVELPRGRREVALKAYVQRYADRLEYYCLRAPFQWFNFFDFWRTERRRAETMSVESASS